MQDITGVGLLAQHKLYIRPVVELRVDVLYCCQKVRLFVLTNDPTLISNHLRLKHEIPAADRRAITTILRNREQLLRHPATYLPAKMARRRILICKSTSFFRTVDLHQLD